MTSAQPYVLIVDADADRIDAAVRGSGDARQLPAVVARTCGDATHMLEQLGPPAVLMIALALPDGDGLSVVESLGRIDGNASVIAWTADRDVREYATSRMAHMRAKVLGGTVSPALYSRCVSALLGRGDVKKTNATPPMPIACDEDWQDLAESARQRLCVIGAATYTKVRGAAEYTMSVSWRPESPTPDFPVMLSSAIDQVLTSGVAKVWTDFGNVHTVRDTALRALAIVPIRRERIVVGVLCAFDLEPHALREQDLDVMSAMAAGSMRRGVPAVPINREVADTIIQREFARAGRDHQPLTVMLFAMTAQATIELPPFDDILASVVRGNDLVVRWTSSQMVVVLAGVDHRMAERVAGRISDVVETKALHGIAVSRAVAEVGTAESLEDTIARAAATMSSSPSDSPSAEVPRLPVPSRGYRATTGASRRSRPPA